MADKLGLPQQVCKAHVVRNTEALLATLAPLVAQDRAGRLSALGVTPAQAAADLEQVGTLIQRRQPQEVGQLVRLHRRSVGAHAPRKGETASLAYRLRTLFLDRWNLWSKLTRYRTWRGPKGERIEGTNHGCKRGIDWWVKERSRPMRGYKREQSAANVSRLLAWCGNQLDRGGADLALLLC